jgi:ABC-type transport system involved in multi-copper enzyme maturation permease subunit
VTFLPIVERELRVAARRPMTFWLRIIAALVAFGIASGLFTLFVSIPGGMGAQPGGPLFAVLTWMSLAVCLAAGLFFTSDALSEEKREGTLGFLFLTDLRGYDVVFGKLLATSCRCVFALLAIFPILACTQLMGGVEGGQFWRTLLALLHTLFFSLVVGIFVSALSRHPQKSLAATLALLFILLAGGATGDSLYAYATGHQFRPVLSLASPITVFLHAGGSLSLFWRAFVVSEVVAWLLLAAACLLIPRAWQEKTARSEISKSPWRTWWRLGGPQRREHLRVVVLSANPLKWLACRERWQSLLLWGVAVVMVGWFGATSLFQSDFWDWAGWWSINGMATLILYLWTASQASQVFAEMKRAGLIELLLAVPLDFRKVAPGAWWGMVRLFGVPITIIVLVQFLATVTGIKGAGAGGMIRVGSSGVIPEWVMLWLGAGIGLMLSLANFVALIWFGLWMGLVSRNSMLATLKTIAFVQILPWLVITFSSAMTLPILMAIFGGFGGGAAAPGWIEWYALISTGVVAVMTLAKDWLFWSLARRQLVDNFRRTATQAVAPMVYRKMVPPVATPPNLPPVIPPSPPSPPIR